MFANYHLPYVWEVTRGLTFWEGYSEVQEQVGQARQQSEDRLGRQLDAVERFRLAQRLALDELAQHPATYAQRWIIGVFKTLLGPGVLDVYDAYGLHASRVVGCLAQQRRVRYSGTYSIGSGPTPSRSPSMVQSKGRIPPASQ